MKKFYDIYRKNYAILKLLSSFANHSSEEIKEIALFVFYTHPEIEEYLSSGDCKMANRIFRREYRNEAKKDTTDFRTNERADAFLTKYKATLETENEIDIEEITIKKDFIEYYKQHLTEEQYDILMSYYTYGQKYTSELYNIKTATLRKKVGRWIARLRKL